MPMVGYLAYRINFFVVENLPQIVRFSLALWTLDFTGSRRRYVAVHIAQHDHFCVRLAGEP